MAFPARTCFLLTLACLVATSAAASAQVVVGVNMTNADRLNPEQQDAMLAAMKAAGVHAIRAILSPNDKGIDFARHAYAQGIRIDWQVGFGGYEPGAPTRPYRPQEYPGMWSGHPLSYADPDQFRAYFAPLLAKLDAAGVTLAAFELGNEINWAAFNPDFPIPGEGKVLSLSDLSHDPEDKQVAKGFLQYIKILAVLKDVRDHSRLNRHTSILTAGLVAAADGAKPYNNKKEDMVSLSATIAFLRAHGLDALVDGYGIHTYPSAAHPGDPGAAAQRAARFRSTDMAECRSPGTTGGKPCWITEWGFDNRDLNCPTNDKDRASLVREMMGDFLSYARKGQLAGMFYFSWNTDPWAKQTSPKSLFRCGALTESGRLALDAALLR